MLRSDNATQRHAIATVRVRERTMDKDRDRGGGHRSSGPLRAVQPRAVGWGHVVMRVAGMVTLVVLIAINPDPAALVAASTAVVALISFRSEK